MPTVLIFAKPPLAGKVKTRLIPKLGPDRAALVFRHCLQYTLDLVARSGINYQLWLSEDSQDNIFAKQPYLLQQGDNLGSRMLHALGYQLPLLPETERQVLLIGSDCLDMRQTHFEAAIDALQAHDVVLLPALDGGYALIGCRRIDALLFKGIEWSTDKVLVQTLANAQQLNYRVLVLDSVRDIDTIDDLKHYPELLELIK